MAKFFIDNTTALNETNLNRVIVTGSNVLNWHIAGGYCDATGILQDGCGVTCTASGNTYTFTFSTPYSTTPIIIGTVEATTGTNAVINLKSKATNSCVFEVSTTSIIGVHCLVLGDMT